MNEVLERAQAEIFELINRKNFRGLALKLIDYELLACNAQQNDVVLGFFALEMLSLLSIDDIQGARYFWKRLSPAAKRNREIARAWVMGAALFKKDYPVFFAAANFGWNPRAKIIVDYLVESIRNRNADLVGRAYTVVSVPDAAALLGMSPDETLALARARGWEYDGKMLKPVPPPPRQTIDPAAIDLISNMTQYAVGLDG